MKTMKSHKNHFISKSKDARSNLWRNNLILFFALLILIFVAPQMDHLGRIVTRTALVMVAIAGIFAAEHGKYVFNLLLSLGFLILLSMALSILFPEQKLFNILTFMLIVLSLNLSTTALIFHISTADTVEKSTILCAINSYLLMGLTASTLFIILDLFVPNSFINLETGPGNLSSYIYFGFVTLTTLGYGDISPNAPLARSLSIFVAVGGQLYLVIIMALIIGKFLYSKNRVS